MSVLFSRLLNNTILSKEAIFLSNMSPAEKKKESEGLTSPVHWHWLMLLPPRWHHDTLLWVSGGFRKIQAEGFCTPTGSLHSIRVPTLKKTNFYFSSSKYNLYYDP